MIDKRLYCETFSRLCASEEAKKEVFQLMNEKKQARHLPKVLRAGAIAAVMTVALAVTAGAADLASGGALFRSIREVWSDGYETRYEAVDRDGNQLMLSVSEGARIERRDDGRVMVLCAAGEEVDITAAMAGDGAYHFEKSTESRDIQVDVTGSVEKWELTETTTDADGTTYTNHFTSDDVEAQVQTSVSVAADMEGEPDENGVVNSSIVTVTRNDAAGSGDVTVTDRTTGDPLVVDETKRDYRSGLFSIQPAETPEEP